MAINFPDSPIDGQEAVLANNTWMYSTSKSAWLRVNRGVDTPLSVDVYANISELPLSGVAAGQQAFVESSNALYISNGSGWYSISLVNTNPSITAVQDASAGTTPFTLATDGTATVITITASDPEEVPLTYSYAVTTGSLNGSTVTQANNVFTITPHASNDTTFDLTFTASDGINHATSGANSFTLSFGWSQQAKLQSSDIAAYDYFGTSVSISNDGNTAIVGARGEDTTIDRAGSVYIFTRSGTSWNQQAKLQASDATAAGDRAWLGRSVSISNDGNTVIAGANAADHDPWVTSSGAAYIFTRSGTTWSQQAKIESSDIEANDSFGWDVSISGDGDTVIVGAYEEDTTASDAGSAYIFTRSGTSWSQQAKIQSSDASATDYFGYSVSISNDGDTAIIGAYFEDPVPFNSGAAYIFTRSGTSWSQQAKLVASNAENNDRFGNSVYISGDGNTSIVGAYLEDTGGSNAGAAYIFTRSGTSWSEQDILVAGDADASDGFGKGVCISNDGNTAISSAIYDEEAGAAAGSAYVFTRSGTTWTQQSKIIGSDTEANDYFGEDVSISGDGNTIIVGSAYEETNGADAGSIYIFTI